MFERNEQFKQFRDKLKANGVILRFMWEARSGVNRRRGPRPNGISKIQWNNWPDVAGMVYMITSKPGGKNERNRRDT